MNEKFQEENRDVFLKYVDFLDNLPNFELTEDEKMYVEEVSSGIDMENLDKINESKISAVENPKSWFKENIEFISQYEDFKNSEEYKNSPMKKIQEKLQRFLLENDYYKVAIPLIRKFSKSYDDYYKKLILADEEYKNLKTII